MLWLPFKTKASTTYKKWLITVLRLWLPFKTKASTTSKTKRPQICRLWLPFKTKASTTYLIQDELLVMLWLPFKTKASTTKSKIGEQTICCDYLSKQRLLQQKIKTENGLKVVITFQNKGFYNKEYPWYW